MEKTQIKVMVKFFGSLSELTGLNEKEYDSDNLADLKTELFNNWPELKNRKVAFAVNHELQRENVSLNSGDEIALLPPFAGG